jgi:predicted transcriptional regulator
MGRKRFRDQILRRILEVCAGGGASKTHIVYNINLNFRTVGPYIELLTKNGLAVRVEGTPTRYKTTAKGGTGAEVLSGAGGADAGARGIA